MTVFVCADCDAVLSAPVSQLALPVHAHRKWANGVLLPVLMEPGTYAVDPAPWGQPRLRWREIGEHEAAARGVRAGVRPVLRSPGSDRRRARGHPRTGEPWQPSGTVRAVPLPGAVWGHLAFPPRDRLPLPATGGLPDGVLRDDPPPMRPWRPLWPDREIFLDTLARLPAVRQPWLRGIYDRVRDRSYPQLF